MARFQVVEVGKAWAVQDQKDGAIWTGAYVRFANAAKKAIRLNETFGNANIWDETTNTYKF